MSLLTTLFLTLQTIIWNEKTMENTTVRSRLALATRIALFLSSLLLIHVTLRLYEIRLLVSYPFPHKSLLTTWFNNRLLRTLPALCNLMVLALPIWSSAVKPCFRQVRPVGRISLNKNRITLTPSSASDRLPSLLRPSLFCS